MRDAFFNELERAAADDRRIVFMTADLGYKLFDAFAARHPERFMNMGVCEANMISIAAGLAIEGLRPITYSIVPFATARCLEQIRDDVCGMELPVVIVGVGGGYAYGVNGPTHHGVDDVALLRALPGMTVLTPCDPLEVRGALRAALKLEGPAYLRLGRNREPTLTDRCGNFSIGRPTVLRPGRDVALIACGPIASEALTAADLLDGHGIRAQVWSAHTVKPLDGLVEAVRVARLEHVFVVEEHGRCGGLAEALSLELFGLEAPPRMTPICAPDRFFHATGSQAFLRHLARIDAGAIAAVVSQTLRLRHASATR